ncbi:DnaJ domain-containing protein [Leptospira sp. 96542]|nr:DnaJ domain-containing protein [Leptospira sp. 96542]
MNFVPPKNDLYEILEIPFGATTEEIKSSFRRLAKQTHPDITKINSGLEFQSILIAYQILTSDKRKSYDDIYKKNYAIQFLKRKLEEQPLVLPISRVRFSTGILDLAKRGLMRKGFRNKDRRKVTGINYDLMVDLKETETQRPVIAVIPLTVRIVCRDCMGSDPHCPSCAGKGSYKSSRNLKFEFPQSTIKNGRIFEFDLSKFRPDSFTHFKKKSLRVKLIIHKIIPCRARNVV